MNDDKADRSGFFGHPKGLSTLFFTEMWERFSYYGMRAFLILYMIAPVEKGGLGWDKGPAGKLYGTYTGSVWLATIGGGLIADWWLGQYRSVLVGGILITLGHFTLAFHALPAFYAGLALIVIGTGLLKPNVSTLVGSLYEQNDARRDAGFSIFYMGINLGATIGPLIAGYLAQKVDWHIGFACAGVGMTAGLIQYVLGRRRLQIAIDRLGAQSKKPAAANPGKTESAFSGFTTAEYKRLMAVVVFFLFATIFWGAYEQAGSTLNIFADQYTRLSVFGFSFPSSWFQSVPSLFVILLAPAFAWLWVRLGPREPSSPAKFAIGLFFVGLSFLLLVPASSIAQGQGIRVSPMWLIMVYLLQEFGELCLGPVGLSLVTKLAPQRVVGLMMGVWFLSLAAGDKIAGQVTQLMDVYPLTQLFGGVGLVAIAVGVVLVFLIKPIKNLMGGVH
ncbi:MAG: dipeptide/tripeptide permease [Acidobacteria bacterium]|nr:MAG: dipeptide/tripeptide permease [Acidobacteriota bacterium]